MSGRTGGSMLTELLIAGRAIGAAASGLSGAAGNIFNRSHVSSNSTTRQAAGQAFVGSGGGLVGVAKRAAGNAAAGRCHGELAPDLEVSSVERCLAPAWRPEGSLQMRSLAPLPPAYRVSRLHQRRAGRPGTHQLPWIWPRWQLMVVGRYPQRPLEKLPQRRSLEKHSTPVSEKTAKSPSHRMEGPPAGLPFLPKSQHDPIQPESRT